MEMLRRRLVFAAMLALALAETGHAVEFPSTEPAHVYDRYTKDVAHLQHSLDIEKRQGVLEEFAATATDEVTNSLMAGASQIVSGIPQFVVDGRRYLPSHLSLTSTFSLQRVNALIGEVVDYERAKALAAARESACNQRTSCIWNQNFARITSLFRSAGDERQLMNIDCNAVFAGCERYQ